MSSEHAYCVRGSTEAILGRPQRWDHTDHSPYWLTLVAAHAIPQRMHRIAIRTYTYLTACSWALAERAWRASRRPCWVLRPCSDPGRVRRARLLYSVVITGNAHPHVPSVRSVLLQTPFVTVLHGSSPLLHVDPSIAKIIMKNWYYYKWIYIVVQTNQHLVRIKAACTWWNLLKHNYVHTKNSMNKQ